MPNKLGKTKQPVSFSKPQLLIFVLVFAAVGCYILVRSFAASNPNLAGDLNNDNKVDALDLSMILSYYGTSNSGGDANSDGTVNALDLSMVLSNYGKSVTSVSWPASYTTGPLGTKNVLPNTSKGVLLIENYGYEGQTWSQYQTTILQREKDMNRKFDGIHVHWGGGGTYNNIANCAYSSDVSSNMPQWIHDQGSLPLISWTPNANLDQIASGSFDSCYKAMADYLRQFPFRIMLRMMWEQDGSWFSWSACNTVSSTASPSEFVSDWQRIVNIFKQEGAGNVGFWWTPTEGYNRTCADQTYPGDAYVDWVGADDYNWDNDSYTTPYHSGWTEMDEIINYNLFTGIPSKQSTWGPHKPFVIGEAGTKYDTAGVPAGHTVDPNRKANWFRNIASVAAPNAPNLHGISFFDAWLAVSEKHDWRVDSTQPSGTTNIGSIDPNTYQGFLDMSHAAIFNSGIAGGAN